MSSDVRPLVWWEIAALEEPDKLVFLRHFLPVRAEPDELPATERHEGRTLREDRARPA